jgi:UDP-3-O-[3-hydroxymyristoyl] glucosamine N-acyltransferase
MGNVKASKVAKFLGAKLIGKDFLIYKISSLLNLKDNSLVFTNKHFKKIVKKKLLILCTKKNYEHSHKQSGISYILCDNPRLAFARVVQKFFVNKEKNLIHKSAIISDKAIIHPSVSIGEYCVIKSGTRIDEGTIIKSHVVVSENVKIGKFCYIKSGTVIGEDGFGFDFDENKIPVRLPHLGSVTIHDNVEIGSLNTIQKGTIDNTIINSCTKLSDHVHIAHNCNIGKNCIISAHAQICGSVKIGKNCWIGANSSIIQNVEIKNNVTIGIGSIIIDSVNENIKIMGFEALDLNSLRKIKKKIDYGKF